MTKLLPVLLVLACAGEARAFDVTVGAGATELLALDPLQHVAVYPAVGVSLVQPFEHVTLIPSLSVEYAPETGYWGLVLALVADFPVSDRVGLDVNVTLLHDQPGAKFSEAGYYIGAGVGCSVFLGKWTVSPLVDVFRGLNVPGWSLVPGVNVAYTL
jgi:hypothetical protein